MNLISASEFFSKVWPIKLLTHETLECRVRDRKSGEVRREFHTSVKELLSASIKYRDRFDVYFGVATRFKNGGKKIDCYRINCVWADLDTRKPQDCVGFSPSPDILVDSGGGTHAYWFLNHPLLVSKHGTEIEAINRGIAKKFSSDMGAIDVSRILRVPGTFNLKYFPYRVVKAYAL